ncbi:hypothetical protein LJC56_02395 [Christensenellaceae bacterium OttesenSCG-928-K19]|nr:hypothetical protein [Christensenellaceae bacterium OttesenSCG-928-K19]
MKKRDYETVSNKKNDVEITEPVKATINASGCDFFCPVDLEIPPNTSIYFWTDIKAYMKPDEVLVLAPRSSAGDYNLMLTNTIGLIDADYYNNEETEGNIKIGLRNLNPSVGVMHTPIRIMNEDGTEVLDENGNPDPQAVQVNTSFIDLTEHNTIKIAAGDRIVQGLFFKRLDTDTDRTKDKVRKGGFGHTGK